MKTPRKSIKHDVSLFHYFVFVLKGEIRRENSRRIDSSRAEQVFYRVPYNG